MREIIVDTHCHIFDEHHYSKSSLAAINGIQANIRPKQESGIKIDTKLSDHTKRECCTGTDLQKSDCFDSNDPGIHMKAYNFLHCIMSVDTSDWEKVLFLKKKYLNADNTDNNRGLNFEALNLLQNQTIQDDHPHSMINDSLDDEKAIVLNHHSPIINEKNVELGKSISTIDSSTAKTMSEETSSSLDTTHIQSSSLATVGIGIHPWRASRYNIDETLLSTEFGLDSSFPHNLNDDLILKASLATNPSNAPKDDAVTGKDFQQSLINMEKLLELNNDLVVGEIGLDKNSKSEVTGKVEIEPQKIIFEKQLEIAIKYRRPISVHCVKSYGTLYDILQRVKCRYRYLPSTSLHSYTGSAELAQQLLTLYQSPSKPKRCKSTNIPLEVTSASLSDVSLSETDLDDVNVYFGFSYSVNFRSQSITNKTKALIEVLPIEHILLESDVFDAEEARSDLLSLAKQLAHWKGMDMKTLIRTTTMNGFRWLKRLK